MRYVSLTLGSLAVLSVLLLTLHTACRAQETAAPAAGYAQWRHGPPADPSYFPIAVWLQGPENAARYKAAGINLYIALWKGPTEKQLADLKAAGMPVICEQNEVGLAHLDDATVVGWMHGDEPDNAQPVKGPDGKNTWGPCVPPQRIVDDYERIRAADPSRPVILNLGQGVANDKWHGRGSGAKLSDYETYVKGGDIISFDIYPVASNVWGNGPDNLWLVPYGVERLTKWTGGTKPLWTCIECTRISGDTRPSPAQVRSEVWMALTRGATGLIYFVHQFKPTFCEWQLLQDPEMLAGVTAINREVADLAPVLNSPTVADAAAVTPSDAEVPISILAKRYEGATYVFAVGLRNKPVQGSFKLAGVPEGAKVTVLGEDRTIPLAAGTFTDSFTPYAVHLYQVK